MRITATSFRKNLYSLLDRVLETGNPIDIERKGKIIRILAIEPKSKLSNLKKRDVINGNPDDIISIDWSKEWKGDENL
jgi:antitoxin (DNA-binding transcriptional repressor) of toxin-antitoxin stability system